MSDGTMTPPFFIVSSGRAGTTLLSTMLNASGQVIVPPESDFVARLYPFYADRRDFSDGDYAVLAKAFRLCSDIAWELEEAELREELMRTRPRSFAEVNSAIYDHYLRRAGAEGLGWGIKRPVLIADTDRILATFPDARIVHMVRDGRDVALSYRQVHASGDGFGPKGIVTGALYWVDGLRRVRRVPSERLVEVRYEDLLARPDSVLQELCDFIGISYTSDMLEDYHAKKLVNVIPKRRESGVHKKVQGGLDSSNFGKYRSELSRAKLFAFELMAAPFLRRYGYELTYPWLAALVLGAIRVPLFAAASAFNRMRYGRRDRALRERALSGA